jgi:hypothetical protein
MSTEEVGGAENTTGGGRTSRSVRSRAEKREKQNRKHSQKIGNEMNISK